MDRGAWRAIVHEVAESDTTEATEQTRYRLEQGGFCSSKTHSVNTYLWVDLVEDQMPLFWPDGPQIHPLVLCLLSTPPLLLSSLGLIPEGARISQAPMSASFAWVRQRGRQQETGGKKWEARVFLPYPLSWACFQRPPHFLRGSSSLQTSPSGVLFFSLPFFFQPICTSELLLLLTYIYLTISYLTSKIFQHWGDPFPTLNSLYWKHLSFYFPL